MNSIGLLLAISCFFSFAWAIKRFFVVDNKKPSWKMNVLTYVGTAFSFLHFWFIFNLHNQSNIGLSVGVGLYVMSFLLFWKSIQIAKKNNFKIAFEKSSAAVLVQESVYRFIRHPIYLSYTLYWIAGCVFVGESILFLSLLIMLCFYISAIRQEEFEFLNGPLKNEYLVYKKTTGMLFPKFF